MSAHLTENAGATASSKPSHPPHLAARMRLGSNCKCRMLFNKLECVAADLKTTKETLHVTANELDETTRYCSKLSNKLECVNTDLVTTKQTLQGAWNELDDVVQRLEECKKNRAEEKRKFSNAIAKMVESEMSDVRTQLSALNLCMREELEEKILEKKAASEAAKAALFASKWITLRLLMF